MEYDSSKVFVHRAYAIWEGILNGGYTIYDETEFSDVEDLIDIDPNEELTNYEVETYMNKCFIKAGYDWEDDGYGDTQLVKQKEVNGE
tara:strand:+ start:2288 stop:2551 length:264 start_codon:yes stop_codon:yes gene_type:complete